MTAYSFHRVANRSNVLILLILMVGLVGKSHSESQMAYASQLRISFSFRRASQLRVGMKSLRAESSFPMLGPFVPFPPLAADGQLSPHRSDMRTELKERKLEDVERGSGVPTAPSLLQRSSAKDKDFLRWELFGSSWAPWKSKYIKSHLVN